LPSRDDSELATDGYWLVPDELSHGPTIIGHSVVMKGELTLDEDLVIEGRFSGPRIDGVRQLAVRWCASVKAPIRGGSADIAGQVEGDVTGSDTVIVRRTSRIRGAVSAADVRVEDGTNLEDTVLSGRIRLADD